MRAVSAARIEETLQTFDEHAFVCRTAQGYSDNGVALDSSSREIGRGKVTDSSLGRVSLADYLYWLDGVVDTLAELDSGYAVGALAPRNTRQLGADSVFRAVSAVNYKLEIGVARGIALKRCHRLK